MKLSIKRFLFLFIGNFLVFSMTIYISIILFKYNPLEQYYRLYKWHYPLQYLFILTLVFSLSATIISLKINNQTFILRIIYVTLIEAIDIPFFLFLCGFLFFFHNNGSSILMIHRIIYEYNSYFLLYIFNLSSVFSSFKLYFLLFPFIAYSLFEAQRRIK
jgi:hypothetical protein